MRHILTISLASVLMTSQAMAGPGHPKHTQDPAIQADHAQLDNDKRKLQADKAAGNKSAIGVDKAAILADKQRLQQHKEARDASKKAH